MAYTKTLWKTGDIVTEEKMNKIEQGIKSISDSSRSLNIIVNVTPQGQAQSGVTIYDYATDTKWSELLDAYRNDLEIRLTAKLRIDENDNDTLNVVARFTGFIPSYNGGSPSSNIDKGTFCFSSIGWVSSNGITLTGFVVNSFQLSKSSNDEIHFVYESPQATLSSEEQGASN